MSDVAGGLRAMSGAARVLRVAAGSLVLASALVLTGCSEPAADLSAATAEDLQAGVLAAAQAASTQQYDAAAAALVDVRASLEAAVDAGEVSAARYRTIDEALLLTEAEVAAARAAQQAQLEADQAAEDEVDPDEDPDEDPDGKPDNPGKGNSGKNDD